MNTNNSNNEEFTITITFEDGLEIECTIVAIFPVKSYNYIALLPLTQHEDLDPEEVFLYRYTTFGSKDSIQLDTIESDEEYNEVADEFDAIIAAHNK